MVRVTAPAYVRDTDTVVALPRDRPAAVRARFRRESAAGSAIAVSTISAFELWYGVVRSGRPEEYAEWITLLLAGGIEVLPFAAEGAGVAGRIRATLAVAGTAIGPYGLLIAAQALSRGATLVTANVGEFSRVRGLWWEYWTISA
jgi:tRNA(fMet)-specific endonuclease VapC